MKKLDFSCVSFTEAETEIENFKPSLPSVSVALILGSALGLLEALILILGTGPILDIMGVSVVWY